MTVKAMIASTSKLPAGSRRRKVSISAVVAVSGEARRDQSRQPVSALVLGLLAAAVFGCGLVAAPAASAASAYSGAEIVARAASQAGLPYCWDGGNQSGPNHGGGNQEGATHCGPESVVGFDCTGLTMYATGLPLAHSSAQATNAVASFGGQRIYSKSELQSGDIVYFGGSFGSFDHAGVYAGGGMMWDADTAYWIYPDGVHERTLASVENALPFVGGVRLSHEGGGGSPAEGSFVSYSGMVYRIAGGAPLYVSNWSAVGGPQPTDALTAGQWAALPAVPRNGTLIGDSATGMVYEIAGGAPLYVSNWAAIGGARATVTVDHWDIENISNPAAHLNSVPANGTLLGASGGGVFVVAGGAPLYVSNWNAIGGPQPSVPIDQWDIENISNPAAHLNPVPANGTFVNARTSTGEEVGSYVIAGGAPFYISTWEVFGGVPASLVSIDAWDVVNATSPAAHLNSSPADGTVVEGLPSDSYWVFDGGVRRRSAPLSQATQVDDVGLAAFMRPAPATQTGAPADLSSVAVSLTGTVDPDGEPVGGCRFEYGTTTGYGSSVPCSPSPGEGEAPVPVSASVTGLAPNSEYHYRIVAVGPGGTSDGADETFKTASAALGGVLGAKGGRVPLGPRARLASAVLFASRSGTINIKIECPAGQASCEGTITIRTLTAVVAAASHEARSKAAILTLATGTFMIAGGQSATLKLHLRAKARALLARLHVLRAQATIVARDPAGTAASRQTIVTIHEAKHSHHRNG